MRANVPVVCKTCGYTTVLKSDKAVAYHWCGTGTSRRERLLVPISEVKKP